MKDKIYRYVKHPFVSGSIIVTSANFIVGFMNYLFNSIASKSLGPEKFSEIITLFSYLMLGMTPLLIVGNELVRRIGAKGKNRQVILMKWEQWYRQLFLSHWYYLFAYLLLLPVVVYFTRLTPFYSFVLLVSIFFAYVSVPYSSALQSFRMFFFLSILSIVAALLKLNGAVLAFFQVGDLETIGFFLLLSGIVPFLIMVLWFRKKQVKKPAGIIPKSTTPYTLLKKIILSKAFLLTAFSLFGITALNNIDVIVAKRIFTAEQAGLYGAWNLFAKIILYVIGPLSSLSFVFFSSAEYKKHHLLFLLVTSFFVLTGGIVLFLLYSLYGSILITIILSSKFEFILPFLPYAAVTGISYTLILFINNFLLARLSKVVFVSFFLAVLYGLILNFFVNTFESFVLVSTAIMSGGVLLYCSLLVLNLTRHKAIS